MIAGNAVTQLRNRIERLEGRAVGSGRGHWSSGCESLDRLLPGSGFRAGTLVEWLVEAEGSGAQVLSLLAARKAMEGGRVLVVLERQREFYAPAAAALGIDLRRIVLVRPSGREQELWALDQSLRCRGVGATWVVVDQLDWRWFRRLQLAAERGGGLGLFVRPGHVRGQPSWSHVQLWVQPLISRGSRRVRVEVARCTGSTPGGCVDLELDEETGEVRVPVVSAGEQGSRSDNRHETRALPLAAQLAYPASRRRSARA